MSDGSGTNDVLNSLPRLLDGDVIGLAYDSETGSLWVSVNGVWQNGADRSERR